MPRFPGRTVTHEDRQRARALIDKVDAKIKAGLLAIEPYEPKTWMRNYGLTYAPAGDPRPAVPRPRTRKGEARLFD